MRVADSVFELIRVVHREVLRGCVADRHELARAGFAMLEYPVDDLAGVVPAGEEQYDLPLPGLDVDTTGIDPGAHVSGRLPQAFQHRNLLLDLSSRFDDHRAGIIESEGRRVLDAMSLQRPVQGHQQVVALVGDAPLVGVGHGHAPTPVQCLEALEGRCGEVVHDDQHRTGRPVVDDVAGADAAAQEHPCALRREDGPAEPAAALREMVGLGAEDRLADDADGDLVAVSGDWPLCARGTESAKDAIGQGVVVLRGIDERSGAVAAMALRRIPGAGIRGRIVNSVGPGCGLVRLSGTVCIVDRPGPGLFPLRGGLLIGPGLQSCPPRLGARDELRYQGSHHRPVVCLELLALDPRLHGMQLLEGDIDAGGHGHDDCTAHRRCRKFLTSG